MTVPLAVLNALNKNGRVYTEESFKQFPESVPVEMGMREDWEIPGRIIGSASGFKTANGLLTADIHLTEADFREIEATYRYVPSGEGDIDGNRRVIGYSLKHVTAIPKAESSFAGLYPDEATNEETAT